MTTLNGAASLYRNSDAPLEDRVQNLLEQMSLKEKVRQLDQYFGASLMSASHPHMHTVMADDAEIMWEQVGEVVGRDGIGCIHDLYGNVETNNALQRYAVEQTRLGIPILFSEEALHGLLRPGFTIYPHAITMASTWNPDLVGQAGSQIAAETRSQGIHETFGPVLDLAREPRWGRVEETFGEDTHLASRMAVAIIKGLQGESLSSNRSVIAEPKHFAVHGIPESGLNHSPASIGAVDMGTFHLPVFEAAFVEGGAINAMCSYNSIDGVPCASDYSLLTQVLRNEWQMPGFVRSDLGAIARLEHAHFTAESPKDAIRQALAAGTDMQYYDYPHDLYQQSIIDLVENGELPLSTVDTAVSRVLRVKFMLGLFEQPYADPALTSKVVRCDKHGATALQIAREGIVLLKNDQQILPLSKSLTSIAVIGPSASVVRLGDYTPHVEGFEPVTVLQGIRKLAGPKTKIRYAKGAGILGEELDAIPKQCLRNEEGEPGLTARYYNNSLLEGEPVLTRTDANIDYNWMITKPHQSVQSNRFSVRWSGKLTPEADFNGCIGTSSLDSMRVWLDGSLLIDGWGRSSSAKQQVSVELRAGKAYELVVEYCKEESGAQIFLGWNHAEEEIMEAVRIAAKSDIAIVCLGDSEETCGEGIDRSRLDLPGSQLKLLKAIYETGTKVVLVLQNGRPLTMEWEADHIPAIIEAWYPGEQGGIAIAEVLFGHYNPAGRLPVSFPRTIGQIPVHYNRRRGGQKNYIDGNNLPLFAFGYGLSYTTFSYDRISLQSAAIHPGDPVLVKVHITNTGSRAGDEVVQLYVNDLFSSIARPEMELRQFRRVHLEAGESAVIDFILTPQDLSVYTRDLSWVLEPGTFRVLVGPSSDRIVLTADLVVLS
ncbi:beta-glucosidase [Paenibacillaceae bacterium]|nr:beta-glucosidase [Paenibacillaceae bacterium]